MLSQRDDSPLVGFTRPTRIESRGWAFIHNPFLCAIFPLQVDTDVMYLLSPNGSIVRSKARLKKEFEQLGVSESDLRFPFRLSKNYSITILSTGSFWNLSLTSSRDPMTERHLRYVNRFNMI